MCGRYVIKSHLRTVEKRFGAEAADADGYIRSPNIAIGERAPVILGRAPKRIVFYHFGLTPFWAKKRMYLINARSEGDYNKDNSVRYTGGMGILQKPAFRRAIRSQRCLVIADAFLEGPKDRRLSEPYVFYPVERRGPFAMAGIWDIWEDPKTGESYGSFAVITTVANDLVVSMGHHRSPVILDPEAEQLWLDESTSLGEITALLQPFDPDRFNAYPISSEIKSPRAKDFELLRPIGPSLRTTSAYTLYEEIVLEGMGETAARRRMRDEESE